MEVLDKSNYSEYEDFASRHSNGNLTQSVPWQKVKDDWDSEIVVTRDSSGAITGGVSILIKKMPVVGTTMLYSPRGPICDYGDKDTIAELKQGIDIVALKHNAHVYKCDPDLTVEKGEAFTGIMKELGFERFAESTGFEGIQTRFNHRLYIAGLTQEEILAQMHHKTRYNIRLSGRRGVTVEVKGAEALDDFMALMTTTGERDGFSIRSKSYFENMLASLGEHIRLYMAYYEGVAVAGAVTSNYGGKTCYIYGASSNEHRNTMAPYLIQWEMIRWAVETGCTVYDFMGVSGDLDESSPLYGLYRFKSGFGGQVDELVGEFDFTYKPMAARVMEVGVSFNELLRKTIRKLGRNG